MPDDARHPSLTERYGRGFAPFERLARARAFWQRHGDSSNELSVHNTDIWELWQSTESQPPIDDLAGAFGVTGDDIDWIWVDPRRRRARRPAEGNPKVARAAQWDPCLAIGARCTCEGIAR